MNPLEFIKKHKVISVVRAENEALALSFSEACIEGGLRLIEVTFSFPGAEDVISSISGREGVLVGAGTVLDVETAEKARGAGARFLVSPHTDEALIDFAKANGMAVVQGAFTSSEIVRAWKLGADMVKIFPVSAVGGPAYVKAMKEPLPQIEIMTTGGVGLDNLADFLRAGASAVGLSTALTGRGGVVDPETITSNARLFARKLEEIDRA